MNVHRIILFNVKVAFLYMAIHLFLFAIVLLKYSILVSIILWIFSAVTLILTFGSKQMIKNNALPLWKEISFHVFLLVFGIIPIWFGLFNNSLLPTGFYVNFRQMSYLYISLGAGVSLISLGTIVWVLLRRIFRKDEDKT